ncbi:hypothetical protein BR93DRAFT_967572 [Coniochaeta sp. PMI_546]|nr:hypothetical protein BR93DRAFT_967572 [Coniochaeta sp. PMI_546]
MPFSLGSWSLSTTTTNQEGAADHPTQLLPISLSFKCLLGSKTSVPAMAVAASSLPPGSYSSSYSHAASGYGVPAMALRWLEHHHSFHTTGPANPYINFRPWPYWYERSQCILLSRTRSRYWRGSKRIKEAAEVLVTVPKRPITSKRPWAGMGRMLSPAANPAT